MPAQFPNAYSTSPLINVGSTAFTVFDLPFLPKVLRIYNQGTVDLYLDFNGNAPSTGTGHIVKAADALVLNPVPVAIGSLGMTTTSTGATGVRVSVLALGDLESQ